MNSLSPRTSNSKDVKKYLFENRNNQEKINESTTHSVPVDIDILRQELESAKEQAFNEGFAEATKKANLTNKSLAIEQAKIIADKCNSLVIESRQNSKQFHKDVASLCYVIIQKLLPFITNNYAIEIVKSILHKSCQSLPNDKPIKITVNSALLDETKKYYKSFLAKETDAEINIIGSDTIDKVDCLVEWQGGGIESYTTNVLQEISTVLLQFAPDDSIDQLKQKLEEYNLYDVNRGDNMETTNG